MNDKLQDFLMIIAAIVVFAIGLWMWINGIASLAR